MPSLSEKEAREFLELLERVDDDMRVAMADGDLSDDAYRAKWGATYSRTAVEAGRGKYRQFAEHAYLGRESRPERDDDE